MVDACMVHCLCNQSIKVSKSFSVHIWGAIPHPQISSLKGEVKETCRIQSTLKINKGIKDCTLLGTISKFKVLLEGFEAHY